MIQHCLFSMSDISKSHHYYQLFFLGSGWNERTKANAPEQERNGTHTIPSSPFGGQKNLATGDPHLLREILLRSRNKQVQPPTPIPLGRNTLIDINSSSGNLSVLVGKQIILICRVPDAGNESVSRFFLERTKNFCSSLINHMTSFSCEFICVRDFFFQQNMANLKTNLAFSQNIVWAFLLGHQAKI